MTRKSFVIAITILLLTLAGAPLRAQETEPGNQAFRVTNLPLPRYASLASDKIYIRTGPGVRFPIAWVYHRKGLPVEIVLEYESWRKIKDIDGDGGWVHQSLVSGKRTGLIQGDGPADVRSKPVDNARLLARLEPQVVVDVEECQEGWCQIKAEGYEGWVARKSLWGIYEGENFD